MKSEERYYNGQMEHFLNPGTCQDLEILVNFNSEKWHNKML